MATAQELQVPLREKLDKIRSPKLEGQLKNGHVLGAVEETIKEQKKELTPTSYFSVLLLLLRTAIPSDGTVDKALATSVVYLLDIVTPYAPPALLRSQFSQILKNLAPALTFSEADAPLLRPSIGCLESLLIAQDTASWEMSQNQVGPRRALAGLLNLALDHRPKIRKRAQDALSKILQNPPPSPSLDHPAAEMCAETALRGLVELAEKSAQAKKQRKGAVQAENEPALVHALQLVRNLAAASGGWPSKNIEALCEVLLGIARSGNEYMATASFEVFEIIFAGMANDPSASKLPRLLEAVAELQPSQNDTQLLPPWIQVISRGYDVSSQLEPEDTFQKLPELFAKISSFLQSSSYNIRVSASECLISFMVNCIPSSVILEPSIYDEKVLEKLGKVARGLLKVAYKAALMEVFSVLGAMFEALRWRSNPVLTDVVRAVGELRGDDAFVNKKEADAVLGKAIRAMGPEAVLNILPLNLVTPGQGRVWLLPILRDYVSNTNLSHFKKELLPLSETMFQRVLDHGESEKTTIIKAYETIVSQTWAVLPGYCDLPLDLKQSVDQAFAELLANLLYKQVDLRRDICRALQNLVETNRAITEVGENVDDLLLQGRISKAAAQANLDYLGTLAGNILAVLFNVYSETLPKYRGYILTSINAYLSITPTHQLMETFENVTRLLGSSLDEAVVQDKTKPQKSENKMPPASHTLMDLLIAISIHLPRESFGKLFEISSRIIVKNEDPQLQKKAYKLIPRLAESPSGQVALNERNLELQKLLLDSAEKVSIPAKRDRLVAISTLIPSLPDEALHFIPSILSEVVIACKEVNERARQAAFDLLVLMGERIMSSPNVAIEMRKVPNMPANSSAVSATLEEYFTLISYGLAAERPHMISASIVALARVLHQFHQSLSSQVLGQIVETMDHFLTAKNREVVKSVLGFVKVLVISLPVEIVLPRLETLIPNLMVWSNEHKAHFKLKVKHIFERMMRRFGFDVMNKHCPEEDRKLLANIRKTKERNKRQKAAAKAGAAEGEEGEEDKIGKRKSRFETGYDEAMYGSDSSDESDEASDDELLLKRKGGKKDKGGKFYIVEDENEPLDLLGKKALASISSTKPSQSNKASTTATKTKVKTNEDGKLILGGPDSDCDDAMDVDAPAAEDEGGVGAYVHAISGKDAVKRGQKGRLKFSNKKGQDEHDEMDVDEEDVKDLKKTVGRERRGGGGGGRGEKRGGKGDIANGRRGLGEQKRSGTGGGVSRVMKPSHGSRGSGGRGRGRR